MSRWNNFLSGIESGLDKILQENEGDASATKPTETAAIGADVSRASSSRRRPDKLQERLSRAVDGRRSGEVARANSNAATTASANRDSTDSHAQEIIDSGGDVPEKPLLKEQDPVAPSSPVTIATTVSSTLVEPAPTQGDPEAVAEGVNGLDRNHTGDQFYLERIEALQAKLDLLIKEAAERAREDQEKAGADNKTRTLARQDERIAGLLAEGQKLSEKELKHVGTIRRLHSRTTDLESSLNKARKAQSDAHREVVSLRAKVESAESSKRTSATEDEARSGMLLQLEQVKKQCEVQAKELATLRNDLEKARSSDDSKEQLDKQKQLLAVEKRTCAELREELDNARIERELSSGRQKTQLEDERTRFTQHRERAASRETELEGEIKVLESRLETIRTRREEETGGIGNQHAKQLRQIEALQRQHSVSKENWGSVEASLNSRISSLEHDRDDLARKETDLRRKLRETSANLRRRDEELENVQASQQELEDKLQERRQSEETAIKDLKEALSKAHIELEEAREESQTMKASLAVHTHDSAPIERIDEVSVYTPHDRSQSPLAARGVRIISTQGDLRDSRKVTGLGFYSGNSVFSERPSSSRKISVASPHIPSNASFRPHSFQSVTRSSSRSAFPEANSVDDERDFSDGLRTPGTPGRGFNDIVSISASNPAAGPSVQLVERMSAAVRRLESEKAATRDELDRMAVERDEARKQVVSLLSEVEAKRALDEEVAKLESQVAETSERYQTTLELLGEKSEAVEELKADIADMKEIYRDALVARVGKI